MGVDYIAKFGLGFKVESSELEEYFDKTILEEGETIEDFIDDNGESEMMSYLDLPDGIHTSYWGNSYSGNYFHFIHVDKPTSKEDILAKWDKLEAFIKEAELVNKVIGIVGGGLLW